MSNFPNVVKLVHQMNNSDLNVVGEFLGYKWNDVCDAISQEGLYAEDGDGATTIRRCDIDRFDNDMIKAIFNAIFNHYENVHEISVLN